MYLEKKNMTQISSTTLQFLEQLKEHNNREWFTENKKIFKGHEQEVKNFFKAIESSLKTFDDIESHKIMRIYRDVRFSKDKTPYKPRFAGGFKRATLQLRGGYWLNIEPNNCMAGGGFYGPEPKDLLRIRKEFEIDDSEIRAIINEPIFKATFGEIQGEEVKTAPKGFNKDHKAIDLIKKKQFYVMKRFSDNEMTSPNAIDEITNVYKTLRPFFDYMSDVLTTNLNGESII